MLKRKIYDKLLHWKQNSNGETALLIDGVRVKIGLNQEKPYKIKGFEWFKSHFFKKTVREYNFIHFDHERIFWNFGCRVTLYARQGIWYSQVGGTGKGK